MSTVHRPHVMWIVCGIDAFSVREAVGHIERGWFLTDMKPGEHPAHFAINSDAFAIEADAVKEASERSLAKFLEPISRAIANLQGVRRALIEERAGLIQVTRRAVTT